MYQIVSRFYAACAAPTRRFRRTLCAASLGVAVVVMIAALRLVDPFERPTLLLTLCGASFVLLAVAIRLALNDVRDVREHYRQSKRDLFVSTFSDEEFQRQVRAKRARLRDKDAGDT